MEPATLAVDVTENVVALIYEDQVFRLRRPIQIHAYRDGDLHIREYKPLGISAYGFTEAEALHAFAEEFSSCWHWIAEEKDGKLGPDAQELKSKLLDLVETVQPANEFISRRENKKRAVQ